MSDNGLNQQLQDLQHQILETRTEAGLYVELAKLLAENIGEYKIALALLAFARSLVPDDEAVQTLLQSYLTKLGKKSLKLAFFTSTRLGHIALELNAWLRAEQLNPTSDCLTLFITMKPIVSEQLIAMYSRELPIIKSVLLFKLFIEEKPYLLDEYFQPLPYENLRSSTPPSLEQAFVPTLFRQTTTPIAFTKEEQAFGRAQLAQMGINLDTGWFVAISARDSAYLDKAYPGHDWSYHDFRNADINSYLPAVEYLIEQGATVVRVGSESNQQLDCQHPNYIDYTLNFREQLNSDFMDIFLVTACKFVIGQNSGLTDVPITLEVPVLAVDYAPALPLHGKRGLSVPKLVQNIKTGQFIPYGQLFSELADAKLHPEPTLFLLKSEAIAKRGYRYVDNAADEIAAATKEMVARFVEQKPVSAADQALEQHYFSLIPESHWLHDSQVSVAPSFIQKHKELYFA